MHAYQADTEGNLTYRLAARNFNPLAAAAGKTTVAEAEHILDGSYLDPGLIETPGVFVHRVVRSLPRIKDIEQRTVRPRPAGPAEQETSEEQRHALDA